MLYRLLSFLDKGISVRDEAQTESFTGGIGVVVIALPCLERWVLKCARKGEGDWPWEWTFVGNGLEILGSLLDALATG